MCFLSLLKIIKITIMIEYPTTFTFVMPCYNSDKYIKQGIESILSINYPKDKFCTIVVDDCSTDRTVSIIKEGKFKNTRLIELSKNLGPANARNIGKSKASTDYVIFIDTETKLDKNILQNYAEAAKKFPKAVFCGKIEFYGHKNLNTEIIERRNIFYMRQGSDSDLLWAATNNLCVPKEVYKNYSFNPQFSIAASEDIDFCFRIRDEGYKILYNNKSIAYHKSFDSFKSAIARMFRYGKGTSIFVKVQPKKNQFAWEFLGRVIILLSFILMLFLAYKSNRWEYLLWPFFHYMFSTYYLFYGNYAKAKVREKGVLFVILTSIYENFLTWIYQLGVIFGNIKNKQSPFLNINPKYISEGGHGGLGLIWFIDDIIIAFFFFSLLFF